MTRASDTPPPGARSAIPWAAPAARQSVAEIAASLGFGFAGDGALELRGVAEPAAASPGQLALAMAPKFLAAIAEGDARAAMVPDGADWEALGLKAAIFAPRAKFGLAGATQVFARPPHVAAGLHPSAVVADDAEIGPDAAIGPLTVVEPRARIGARVRILGQATIGQGAQIGDDAVIFPGVWIGADVRIGARAILHPNAVLGSDGFSFATPERGAVEAAKESGASVLADGINRVWLRTASLGGLVLGDDVEIGAGSALDRGTVRDTIIGDGVKIDNLVQIGHNVRIGDHCLICGQAGVAGSAVLGDRVVLGGQSGVADQAVLGSDVMIMASSGVSGHIPSRGIYGGTPAVRREEIGANLLALRRLPRLFRDVADLKKRFSSTEGSG